ncbi:MAG: hypothetical protein ACYCQJ_09230 [Nitrososphaerales archaeon]
MLVIIGLVAWTEAAPPFLGVQSRNSLQSGLFGTSLTETQRNITDYGGSFSFLFGLDYNQNITRGSASEIAVYCALQSESPGFFTKGVSLSLDGSSVTIDGNPDSNFTFASRFEPSMQIYYFGNPAMDLDNGNHTLQVKLFLSTTEVNYIGYTAGSFMSVLLNGTFVVQ